MQEVETGDAAVNRSPCLSDVEMHGSNNKFAPASCSLGKQANQAVAMTIHNEHKKVL